MWPTPWPWPNCLRSEAGKSRIDGMEKEKRKIRINPGPEGRSMQFVRRVDVKRRSVVDLPQANSDVCGDAGMLRALERTFEENDELMRLLSDS